jgi:hypothetical protein
MTPRITRLLATGIFMLLALPLVFVVALWVIFEATA